MSRKAPSRTAGDAGAVAGSSKSGAEARGRSVSGSKRSGEDAATAPGGDEAGERKKAKGSKKQPAFNPRPVPLPNSSNTPPEEDDVPLPPPPPSERKIARKRESTRHAREQIPDSPPLPKRQKTAAASSSLASSSNRPPSRSQQLPPPGAADPLLADLRADAGNSSALSGAAIPRVDFLNFGKSAKSKPSAPRPTSPPRMPDISSSRKSMGPPTGPYIRKTRKSMRGMGLDGVMAEAMVPIPDRDTPMIKKNREMRGEQARRSSLGMRGQRASSSLGRGEISIPHPSVDSSLLYKHVSSILPEPHRARHLLVYCAKRAADVNTAPVSSSSKGKRKGKAPEDGSPRTDEGDRVVAEIMEEFMANLGKGLVETNVFSDRDVPESVSGLRPHPRNESNRLVKARDEAAIKRGKDQSRVWHSLVQRTNRRQAETVERLSAKGAAGAEPDMSVAPGWMKEALRLANEIIAQGQGDLTDKGEFADVEYKIDTLHAASHSTLQYTLTAARFLDGVFSSLSSDLAPRSRTIAGSSGATENDGGVDTVSLLASAQAGGSHSATGSAAAGASTSGQATGSQCPRTDPMAMLRALAAADAMQAPPETVAAAAKLAPVPVASSSTSAPATAAAAGPSTANLAASTSRRAEAATPRRPGVTPRRAGILGNGTTPKR